MYRQWTRRSRDIQPYDRTLDLHNVSQCKYLNESIAEKRKSRIIFEKREKKKNLQRFELLKFNIIPFERAFSRHDGYETIPRWYTTDAKSKPSGSKGRERNIITTRGHT